MSREGAPGPIRANTVFDLHSHTTCSDGALEPRELIARAAEKGVDVLAITDHDTIDAYRNRGPLQDGPTLVSGIEFSTQWEHIGIHVLGLDIDLQCEAIRAGVRFQTAARQERARRIGENLAKMGIADAYEGAARLAQGSYIGRPHFAQYLVDIGRVRSLDTAFRKFVGDGKAGDVRRHWAAMPQVVEWILEANGIPVLAHPLKYKLTRTRLKRLLGAFAAAGGQGMEVVSGQQNPQQTAGMAQVCADLGLLASRGSDFHAPGSPWAELGAGPPLPPHLTPVWERFA